MQNRIIESLQKQYHGKKVLVVGLGLQGGGVGLAKFFTELEAQVTVTDKKSETDLKTSISQLNNLPIKYTLGSHRLNDFLNADIIFKGPSVPWQLPEIIEAQKTGIPIEMELSFFLSACPSKNIIGITGTRGKSTTTHLIYELLRQNEYKVHLGGNIPNISTVSYLKNTKENDWFVLELPSWPLSGFHRKKISPHIAVFTNLYPDHLNYYKNMRDYLYDKQAIYLYQKPEDYLIINKSLIDIARNSLKSYPAHVVFFDKNDFPYPLKFLKGEHNLENAAAVLKVAETLNLDLNKAREIIESFQTLPYRQQVIGEKDKVIFVNDTTSTTPLATIKAIETFGNFPIILILGGNSKKLPHEELIASLANVQKIILLKGSFTDEILPLLQKKYNGKLSKVFDNLQQAVQESYKEAVSIKVPSNIYILFSPAATSFAMFKNEFHRGDEFNKIVNKLVNSIDNNC